MTWKGQLLSIINDIGRWDFAVMVSIMALFVAIYQYFENDRKNQSRFYLEKYIDASKMVLELLGSDKPTRRIAWVSAEKISEKLMPLKSKITEMPDKEFLEIYLRGFSHAIFEYLRKPAVYYYGIEQAGNMDKAFEMSGHGKIYSTTGMIPRIPEITTVDFSSIKAIVDFITPVLADEYNLNYSNDDEFMNIAKFSFPGIHAYLLHLRSKLENLVCTAESAPAD